MIPTKTEVPQEKCTPEQTTDALDCIQLCVIVI